MTEGVKLYWMIEMRRLMKKKLSHMKMWDMLFIYGLEEEERITKKFDERMKEHDGKNKTCNKINK